MNTTQQPHQPMAAKQEQQPYNPNNQQPQQLQVDNHVLLYIIAIFIPPLAVFMHTGNCGNEFIIDLILSFLFWLPGIIYAIFIIHRDAQAGVQPKMALMQPAQQNGQYSQGQGHQNV